MKHTHLKPALPGNFDTSLEGAAPSAPLSRNVAVEWSSRRQEAGGKVNRTRQPRYLGCYAGLWLCTFPAKSP